MVLILVNGQGQIIPGSGGLLQVLSEDCPIFGQDLLELQGRLGRSSISVDQRQQKFYGPRIAPHGGSGKATKRNFNDRYSARLAVFRHGYFLLNDVA